MTKGSVPGWGKADNNSGSRSRLNDRPPPADFMMARAHRAHPKAEYTTATVPLPKVRDQSVRCLQGESIHELLALLVEQAQTIWWRLIAMKINILIGLQVAIIL